MGCESLELAYLEVEKNYLKHVPILHKLLKVYGPCPQCGKCCRFERLSITLKESEPIRRFDPKFFDDAVFKKWDLFVSFKSPCPYLKKDRCSIYNLRPFVCKIYPFVLTSVEMFSIVDCPFGKRIIDDIKKFCVDYDILITDPSEKQQREVDSLHDFFEGHGLSTGDFKTQVMNIPYEVLGDFMRWKEKKVAKDIRFKKIV